MLKYLKIFLLLTYLPTIALATAGYFLLFTCISYADETTYYLGPVERTYDNTGTLTSEKVYIGTGNTTVVKTKDQTNYLYSDHLGSTVLATKSDGTQETTLQYYPYGQISPSSPNPPNSPTTDKLYTGQRKDNSSDLYFYNARYYNPTTGNFISADRAQGPNRYTYVSNNPIMRNDPTGNCPLCLALTDFFTNPDAAAGDLVNFNSKQEAEAYAANLNETVYDAGNGLYQVTKDSPHEKSITDHLLNIAFMEVGGRIIGKATSGLANKGFEIIGNKFAPSSLKTMAKLIKTDKGHDAMVLGDEYAEKMGVKIDYATLSNGAFGETIGKKITLSNTISGLVPRADALLHELTHISNNTYPKMFPLLDETIAYSVQRSSYTSPVSLSKTIGAIFGSTVIQNEYPLTIAKIVQTLTTRTLQAASQAKILAPAYIRNKMRAE